MLGFGAISQVPLSSLGGGAQFVTIPDDFLRGRTRIKYIVSGISEAGDAGTGIALGQFYGGSFFGGGFYSTLAIGPRTASAKPSAQTEVSYKPGGVTKVTRH